MLLLCIPYGSVPLNKIYLRAYFVFILEKPGVNKQLQELNLATPICLHSVCLLSHYRQSSWDWDYTVHKAENTVLILYRRSLPGKLLINNDIRISTLNMVKGWNLWKDSGYTVSTQFLFSIQLK